MNKLNLSLNVDAIKAQIEHESSATSAHVEDPEVVRKADVLIQTLTTIDDDDDDAMSDVRAGIETMGQALQSEAAHRSRLLERPMKAAAGDEQSVGKALTDLKLAMDQHAPSTFEFEGGWMQRVLGKLPGIGSPLERYLLRFDSQQSVLRHRAKVGTRRAAARSRQRGAARGPARDA